MFLLSNKPIAVLHRNQRAILLFGVFFALLSLGVTLLFPFAYRADAQVLIISKSRYGVDPYTVVKSAERVGENIVQIMKTDDFFQKVMTRPTSPAGELDGGQVQKRYAFDRAPFEDASARIIRKRWNRAVAGSVVYGTGILNVSAYGRNATDAAALASAVVDTLARQGWEYVGGDVILKVVNQPVATRFPARPNVVLNLVFGFLVGGFLMGALAIRRG